jgi:spermidine synthase
LTKPFQILAQVRSPDGSIIALQEHDGEYYIKHNGRQLMSTIATVSELLLSDLGCRQIKATPKPRVLIGGMGLGFTLKRVLEMAPTDAVVHVSELLPEIVQWNRELLGNVNGKLLEDPRVVVLVKDVFEVMQNAVHDRYDAILLDVDHTPSSWVQKNNRRLYERSGFGAVKRALKPGGLVAYWSATHEPEFVHRMRAAGFYTQIYEAKAHTTAKRAVHRIYVGAAESTPTGSESSASKQATKRPVAAGARPSSTGAAGKSVRRRKTEATREASHPFLSPRQIAGLARKERRRAESKPARSQNKLAK